MNRSMSESVSPPHHRLGRTLSSEDPSLPAAAFDGPGYRLTSGGGGERLRSLDDPLAASGLRPYDGESDGVATGQQPRRRSTKKNKQRRHNDSVSVIIVLLCYCISIV